MKFETLQKLFTGSTADASVEIEGKLEGTYVFEQMPAGTIEVQNTLWINNTVTINTTPGIFTITAALAKVFFSGKYGHQANKLVAAIMLKKDDTPLTHNEIVNTVRVDVGEIQITAEDFSQIEDTMEEKYHDDEFQKSESSALSIEECVKKGLLGVYKEGIQNEYVSEFEYEGVKHISVKSGFGDGIYNVHVGYGADNSITQIIIDTQVFDNEQVFEKMGL